MEFRKEGGREREREGEREREREGERERERERERGRADVTNHYEFMHGYYQKSSYSFSFIFHCSLPPTSLLHAADGRMFWW